MKYLFVGDIHNHSYMFNDVEKLDKQYNFDRIIFFGDYVDDWNTTNHQSLETLNRVFKLKESNREKYTFLIGNHEISYLGYKCSGHQYELEDVVEAKLRENIDKFDLATSVKCGENIYVCSHAGFTNNFIRELIGDGDYYETTLYYKMVEFNKDILNNLEPFSHCSKLRGGKDTNSSCLWVDKRELDFSTQFEEPYVKYQIVGHTLVDHIVSVNDILYIDTHSTYPDGTKFGDKSYLIWDDGGFIVEVTK